VPARELRRLNLVLVTIDTLRADRLACYGYSKIETPNLDPFAQKGVLFENAVCRAQLAYQLRRAESCITRAVLALVQVPTVPSLPAE
jgi:glucan phosphoethanolaminetransferase (alkaline phosphatase superfamily)